MFIFKPIRSALFFMVVNKKLKVNLWCGYLIGKK